MDVSAKSLILDLLVTVRNGSMPVRALVAAGALFGVAENSVRVALARLLAAEQIERDERGQYRLGARVHAVRAQVDSWRTRERNTVAWDGTWVGVLTNPGPPAPTRKQQRLDARALRFLAFRALTRTLEVRPNNLRGGVQTVRAQLQSLGISPAVLVFSVGALDPQTQQRAQSLWNVQKLESGYRTAVQTLARSEARLARLPARQAMVESFVVGGRVIRTLVLDPLLPDAIAPAAARQELSEAMRRYDRLGRACWSGFRRAFGIAHQRAPLDTRLSSSADGFGTAVGEGVA